jgi:flagellar biogenesis protein FliO
MRIAETIPLGEKRFVALLTVDGREFLIGGSASSVSLLSQWNSSTETPASGKQKPGARETFE